MKHKYKEVLNRQLPRWAKVTLKGIAALLILVVVGYMGLAWYINTHNKEMLAKVTAALNDNLNGTLTIGGMEPTFLQGFPRVSLRLQNVVIRDSLYPVHRHTLLKAGELDLAVNALAFLRGTLEIKKVSITNAAIDMYTDAGGYSTTSVFRKSKSKEGDEGSGGYPELKKLTLDNVTLAINNNQRGKLYRFKVNELRSTINYNNRGWDADVQMNTLVQSMAFSTRKGSFIKDKVVDGSFDIDFDEKSGFITFRKNRLEIGGEDFTVAAKFKTGAPTADFAINIENRKILWKNASHLLSPNITSRLDMFNLKEPIAVKCDIIGDFNKTGDPLIRVNADVNDNVLVTEGGEITNCSFFGVFTNNHDKSKGFNDANSAVKLFNFKGNYGDIPFRMKKMFILDFEKPVAVGDFSSDFDVAKLGTIIDEDLLKFTTGTANVALGFKADIVNFKISKPLFNGIINIKNAGVNYIPRKLDFRDVTVALNFTQDNLSISKITLKSGKSIVNMEGSIQNFLNLYYTDPEKIVLKWNIYSPQLHLGEFMGFLGSRTRSKTVAKKKSTMGNFTEELNLLFEKSNVDMKLRVDKIFYNSFLATDAKADVLLTEKGVQIKNAGLKHAGGFINVDGIMNQSGTVNAYKMNAKVSNVDVRQFFKAFDNFGLESLQSDNLRGGLSAAAAVSGRITNTGTMVPKSMDGKVAFSLKKGALLKFEPVKNVGKFAFPFRDMDNITFNNLNGTFTVKGEKVTIEPMQVNSSVLNMDIAGVYSFNRGTNITVDVPLRNPKKDKGITDADELAKRRNRGIVLHLIAEDDENGKVKVKLGSGNKKD
jgi:hypothetical protein